MLDVGRCPGRNSLLGMDSPGSSPMKSFYYTILVEGGGRLGGGGGFEVGKFFVDNIPGVLVYMLLFERIEQYRHRTHVTMEVQWNNSTL